MKKINYRKYQYSGVYCIKNTINGKIYIGSAVRIGHRWDLHINSFKNNKHRNRHLQRAWNKYGCDNFIFYVVEKCDKNCLLKREQYYMDKYDVTNPLLGYNICPNARSSLGVKRTKKSKNKMSATKLMLYASGKLVSTWKGKKLSSDHKRKIGLKSLGRGLNTHVGFVEHLSPSTLGMYKFEDRYRARIWHNKKRWNLGCYLTRKDAEKALVKANKTRKNLGDVEFEKYIFAVSENNKNKRSEKMRVKYF